jgi:protein SCO1/2
MGRFRLALAILVLSSGSAATAGATDVREAAAIDPARLGAALPADLVLTDAAGRPVALGEFLGERPLLLAPIDYDCKNICGFTLTGLLGALDELA